MKIATVLMMHDAPLPGGELFNHLNLTRTLKNVSSHEVQSYIFTDKKPGKGWKIALDEGMKPQPRDRFVDVLETHDAVIFSAPGSRDDRDWIVPWWSPELKKLHIPFLFQIQCEDNERIFCYRDQFYTNEVCVGIIEIESGFVEMITPGAKQKRFRIAPWDYVQLHLDQPKFEKERLVVSTSMLASRKRVVALVNAAEAIADAGFELRIGGASFAWSSLNEMKEIGGPWTYVGEYENSVDVEGPAMFHYNGTSKGIRRVELATYQAVLHGCVPILNTDFAPLWADEDNCVLVTLGDSKNFTDNEQLGVDLRTCASWHEEMHARFLAEFRKANPMQEYHDLITFLEQYA